MNQNRFAIWESLFHRAMAVLDGALPAGMPEGDWSFGGGTVLMLKHHHRFSKDIDIFLPEPQYLGYLSPRLNDAADRGSTDYIEQHGSLKIYYPEGEVDFVAAAPLTPLPFVKQVILGRKVSVETPLEIVAKKIRFRAADFKARDLFDLALVLERENDARPCLRQFLENRREILQARFRDRNASLREDFAAIDALDYQPSYDDCVAVVEKIGGIALL